MKHFRAYCLRFLEFNLHLVSTLVTSTTIHLILPCVLMTRIIMAMKFLTSILRIYFHLHYHLHPKKNQNLSILQSPTKNQNLSILQKMSLPLRFKIKLLVIMLLSRRDPSSLKQDLFLPLCPFVLSNLKRILLILKSIIILGINF